MFCKTILLAVRRQSLKNFKKLCLAPNMIKNLEDYMSDKVNWNSQPQPLLL